MSNSNTPAAIVAVNPRYNLFLGNLGQTMLLSQLVFWDQRKSLKRWGETWVVKTSEQLAQEICHPTASTVGDWLREFKKMGLIKVKRGFWQGINQLWIQVDHAKIADLLRPFVDESKSDISEVSEGSNFENPEVSDESKSDISEVSEGSNFENPELSGDVTSEKPNFIIKDHLTEITKNKDNNHQRGASPKTDDDVVDLSKLSDRDISAVTKRCTDQFNLRKGTIDEIKNFGAYLQKSLEEAAKTVVPAVSQADPFPLDPNRPRTNYYALIYGT